MNWTGLWTELDYELDWTMTELDSGLNWTMDWTGL